MYHWVTKATGGIAESFKNIINKKEEGTCSGVDGLLKSKEPIPLRSEQNSNADKSSRIKSVITWCRDHAQRIYPSRQVHNNMASNNRGHGGQLSQKLAIDKDQSNNKIACPVKKLCSMEDLRIYRPISSPPGRHGALRTTLSDTSIECSRKEIQSVDIFSVYTETFLIDSEQSSTIIGSSVLSQDVSMPARETSAVLRRRRSNMSSEVKRYPIHRRRSSHSKGPVCRNRYKKKMLKFRQCDSSPRYRTQKNNSRYDFDNEKPTYLTLKRDKKTFHRSFPMTTQLPARTSQRMTRSPVWLESASTNPYTGRPRYVPSTRVMVIRTSPTNHHGNRFFKPVETRSVSVESSSVCMSKSTSSCVSSRPTTITSCLPSVTSSLSDRSSLCTWQQKNHLNKSASHNTESHVQDDTDCLKTDKAPTGPVTCLQKSYAMLSDFFRRDNTALDSKKNPTVTRKPDNKLITYRTKKSPQKSNQQPSKYKRTPKVSVKRSQSKSRSSKDIAICTDKLEFSSVRNKTGRRGQYLYPGKQQTIQPVLNMATEKSALYCIPDSLSNNTSPAISTLPCVKKSSSEGELDEKVHVKLRIHTAVSGEAGDTQSSKISRIAPTLTYSPSDTDPGLNSLHSSNLPTSVIQSSGRSQARHLNVLKGSPPRKNISIRKSSGVKKLQTIGHYRNDNSPLQHSAPNTPSFVQTTKRSLSEIRLIQSVHARVKSRETEVEAENQMKMLTPTLDDIKYTPQMLKSSAENVSVQPHFDTSGYSSLVEKSYTQYPHKTTTEPQSLRDISELSVQSYQRHSNTHDCDTNESRHDDETDQIQNSIDQDSCVIPRSNYSQGTTAWYVRGFLLAVLVYLGYSVICMLTRHHLDSCWNPMDALVAWICTKLVRAFKLIHVDPPPI